VNWRVYAFHFGWTLVMHEAMRSKRWNVENKVVLAMVVGPALGALMLVVGLVWVFTGRGRRVRRALGHDRILVIPFSRRLPVGLQAELDELRARHAAP
jgi:hypothetical protein